MENSDNIYELISYKTRLEQTLKGTSSGTFVHDFENEVLHIDEMTMKLLGVEKSVISLEEWLNVIHPDDIDKTSSKLSQELVKQTEHINMDYRVRTQNIDIKHLQVKSIIQYENNVPKRTFGIITNISDQKKNENELLKKNRELENFASVVSHDLLSPLNSIIGFSDLLLEKMTEKNEQSEIKFAKLINESSLRMKNLITDLLEYSKIGTDKLKERIDCNQLLNEVLDDLSGNIHETKSNIKIDNLPIIYGNKLDIRRLFQNLIQNGIKFRKSEVVPKILISFREIANFYEFSIQDNGIGIEKGNFEKVFLFLEKLGDNKYNEGFGIGLSTCKKIVSEHNGEIWVKSEPKKGSTFYFTIQKH